MTEQIINEGLSLAFLASRKSVPAKIRITESTIGEIMSGWISHFMNLPAKYLHWGWVQISVTNLIVIVLMLALFALAVLVPFPSEESGAEK